METLKKQRLVWAYIYLFYFFFQKTNIINTWHNRSVLMELIDLLSWETIQFYKI